MSKPIGKPIIGAFVVGAVAIVVAGLFVLGVRFRRRQISRKEICVCDVFRWIRQRAESGGAGDVPGG